MDGLRAAQWRDTDTAKTKSQRVSSRCKLKCLGVCITSEKVVQ